MITSIQIEGLRGIRRGRLEELAPLTLLTGPNGCGKSTVLDALFLGAAEDVNEAIQVTTARRGSRTGRWLFRDQGQPRASLKAEGRGIEAPRTLIWEEPGEDAGVLRWTTRQAGSWEGAVHFDAHGEPRPKGHKVAGVPITLFDTSRPTDVMDLYRRMFEQRRKRRVIESLGPLLPDLEDLERLPGPGGGDEIYLGLSVVGLPARVAGDGVQAAVQLALVLGFYDARVVLLEEPEVFLHPRSFPPIAALIVGAVREGRQVVLTTHSLELIDGLLEEASGRLGRSPVKAAVFNLALGSDGTLKGGRTAGEDARVARDAARLELR
jgi:hypothetical protein